MQDDDFIVTWLLGLIFLIGMTVVFYVSAPRILNAAYDTSTPIVEHIRNTQ